MAASAAKGGVYVALVGGGRQVNDHKLCVCLLQPEEVKELLDFSSGS